MKKIIPYEPPFDQFNIDDCKSDLFVCTIQGAVHELFLSMLKTWKAF